MGPELRAYLDENRRHFDVVAERMTAQVQLVAEGVTALAERLDRVERDLREEILGAQRELSAMQPAGLKGAQVHDGFELTDL